MIRFPTEDTERKNHREHRGNNSPYCIISIANWYYSTLDIKSEEREFRLKTAENLQTERVSQRGIARSLRMSRTAIRKNLKKRDPPDLRNGSCLKKMPGFGDG